MILYHGWLATTGGGIAPPPLPSASPAFSSSSSSSSKGLAGTGGVLGLEPSPLGEDREPILGRVASPGGGGAFFFLDSDWTRASHGGSLGLWVPLDMLDSERQIGMEWSQRGRQQNKA